MNSASFLFKAKTIIEEKMHDPQFGVGELAEELAMSRSSLLRQIKKEGLDSVNQLIKDVRLQRSRVLLEENKLNISEISYEVGFSSPSYFIKCFKEAYGYSPGSHFTITESKELKTSDPLPTNPKGNHVKQLLITFLMIVIFVFGFWLLNSQKDQVTEKPSIAVLPFVNETGDSTQLYLANGMMESILNNLQKLGDIRVISRTSVEQYRNSKQSVADIAEELQVHYLVEGSFQRYQEEMLLTVQLIDGAEDGQLWSDQYRRKMEDIFNVQAEVSSKIAEAIQVVISPEVQQLINKKPTESPQAYDEYLQGVEWTGLESELGLDSAIVHFQRAIKLDPQFALAHAYLGVCFYYKDIFKIEKEFTAQINQYSDRALLLDAKCPPCLISKALYYMQIRQYTEAVSYFEQALVFAPNSATAHNYLAEIYTNYLPDTEKYLIHALTASQLDLSGNDSSSLSYTHLHLANAFAQSGMLKKAEENIHQSLAYNPDNIFSLTLEVYIDLATDYNLQTARNRLEQVYKKDTMRLDVLQELGKVCYTMEDYSSAAVYYRKLLYAKQVYGLNIYPEENVILSYVFEQIGNDSLAGQLMKEFKVFVNQDQSQYKNLHQAFVEIREERYDEAIQSVSAFNQSEDFMYWVPAFIVEDPLFSKLSTHPEFDRVMTEMKTSFENNKSKRISKLQKLDLL